MQNEYELSHLISANSISEYPLDNEIATAWMLDLVAVTQGSYESVVDWAQPVPCGTLGILMVDSVLDGLITAMPDGADRSAAMADMLRGMAAAVLRRGEYLAPRDPKKLH